VTKPLISAVRTAGGAQVWNVNKETGIPVVLLTLFWVFGWFR
jgi:hypothetical protein